MGAAALRREGRVDRRRRKNRGTPGSISSKQPRQRRGHPGVTTAGGRRGSLLSRGLARRNMAPACRHGGGVAPCPLAAANYGVPGWGEQERP